MCLGVSVPLRGGIRTALGRGRAVATLAGLAAVVGVWAASVPGPPRTFGGPQPSRSVRVLGYNDTPPLGTYNDDASPFRGPRREANLLELVLGWSAVLLVVGGILLVVVLLVRAWLRNRVTGALPPDDSTGPTVEGLAVAVTEDGPARLTALSIGTPAEGIVAAWTRLEDALRRAGLPLPDSRTSTETTVAALGRFVTDQDALTTLAALYREASWSRHPLTEADRERAGAALRTLDAQLTARRSEPARG